MKHLVLPLALALMSCTAMAEDSVISFSMGQKTLHFDLEGYEFDGIQLLGVKSSATAVYAALGYEYSKKGRGSGLAFCLKRTKQDLTRMAIAAGQVLPFA